MTEREYIQAGDLALIRSMECDLNEIIAENNPAIDQSEYATVRAILRKWRESSFAEKLINQQ